MQDFSVSIYPLKDGKFLASFLHPLSKKRIREHFETRQSANEYKIMTENKFKRNKPTNYQELLVEDLLILFMQDHPKSVFAKKKCHISDFVSTFGAFKVDELSTAALKAWLDQIQSENNLKEISMRGLKASIETFFHYLIRKEVISESPLTPIYYKKEVPEVASRNILSKSQIKELLNEVHAYSPGYLYPIIKLFEETAAKLGEVVDLTWKHVDIENKEIHFPATESSQERKIKISKELADLLAKQKKTNGPVFMTYYRESFTKNKLYRLVTEFKIKSQCKIPWTLMDLRHSYAVNFLKDGGDIKRLQYILGHHSVFDTKRLYGEAVTFSPVEFKNPFENGS